jgi:hypothetical protein
MTLLNNQGEPVSIWWIRKSMKLIQLKPDIFSRSKLREARIELIAGTNRLDTIEGWLLAANMVEKNKKKNTEYYLTHFGMAIYKNDPDLQKSSSWWAIHLNLCFSDKSDPYAYLFKILGSNFKGWMLWKDILDKLKQFDEFRDNKDSSLESVASGIRRMFVKDRPLAGIGMLNVRKQSSPPETWLQLGSPAVADEVIVHGLAVVREKKFSTRPDIRFTDLAQTDIHAYLCLSPDELRLRLRDISRNQKWHNHFRFVEAVELNTITFLDDLKSINTILTLTQESKNLWL